MKQGLYYMIVDRKGTLEKRLKSFEEAYNAFVQHLHKNDFHSTIKLIDSNGEVHIKKRKLF